MLVVQIISVCALLCSMYALYITKKQEEQIDMHWVSIYYLIAFLQSEHEDFGIRTVKMKDTTGKDIELE